MSNMVVSWHQGDRLDGAMTWSTQISEARRLTVTGRVQGVGFRPFIYRIATARGLSGWVRNEAGRVEIHVQGAPAALDCFVRAVESKRPSLARPRLAEMRPTACQRLEAFRILDSAAASLAEISLPPDLFVCDACLLEMSDPSARRYRYPFINCTQCGPRYTIICALPYDRPTTSMVEFAMCTDCRAEYENPADRRFHAQPLACPACGPSLKFVEGTRKITQTEQVLAACTDALRAGRIVAAKGVGGYHLLCDANNAAAVEMLRVRKRRPDKPLAVMFPLTGEDGLAAVRADLDLGQVEADALADPARPIVLIAKRPDSALPENLAPGLSEIGALLPYSPLHHLLSRDFGGPFVATSANLSGEPVLTEEGQVEARLATVADAFLHHDRPILRPADDSVLRRIQRTARPVRLGRGAAPLELELSKPLNQPVLALGGQMKTTIALGWGRRAVISPHIGDLDSPRSLEVFERTAEELPRLYEVVPSRLLCDGHPGYAGTRWAERRDIPTTRIAHHYAHASALAWERPDIERWLIFAWDGVGYGPDGTLWGGEALVGRPGSWRRAGSFRAFRPIGGDKAARQPWRSAAALCWAAGREFPRSISDLALACAAWERGANAPQTSAVGRLFDAAACLALGIDDVSFEGQGPMLLEAAAQGGGKPVPLPLGRDAAGVLRLDWVPLLDRLLDATVSSQTRAADFHATLVEAALAQAQAIRKTLPFDMVGLTGGVFQNRRLSEAFGVRFAAAGLDLHLAREVPVNDAGLAFGQIIEYAALVGGN